MKKKAIIIVSVILLSIIVPIGFFYLRFINLDTYKWDTNKDIISYGDIQYIQYKDAGINPDNLELGKQIGKIEGESSFRVWEIKGEKAEDYIVITGFMFPRVMYKQNGKWRSECTQYFSRT